MKYFIKHFFVYAVLAVFASLTVLFQMQTAKTVKEVSASGLYARICSEEAFFYSDEICENAKFLLPYSYYVRVISQGDNVCRIRFGGFDNVPHLVGYVKTDKLVFVDETPTDPYPKVLLNSVWTAILFYDSGLTVRITTIPEGTPAVLYGEFENTHGEQLLFIFSETNVCYAKRDCFAAWTLADHPTPMPSVQTITSDVSIPVFNSTDNSTVTSDKTRIIIILAACLAAISVVYFIFVPTKKNRAADSSLSDDDV